MIISVMSQKGGVGKTTTALNLAHYFVLRGKKVAIVDADYQQSAFNFLKLREEKLCDFFSAQGKEIEKTIKKLRADYDVIVIDTSPRLDQDLKTIVGFSDKILVLSKCSQLDFFALEETINLVKSCNKANKAQIVLTQVNKRSKSFSEMLSAVEELGITVSKVSISASNDYVNSINELRTLFELKSKKVGEIQLLGQELIK